MSSFPRSCKLNVCINAGAGGCPSPQCIVSAVSSEDAVCGVCCKLHQTGLNWTQLYHIYSFIYYFSDSKLFRKKWSEMHYRIKISAFVELSQSFLSFNPFSVWFLSVRQSAVSFCFEKSRLLLYPRTRLSSCALFCLSVFFFPLAAAHSCRLDITM